MPWLSRNHDIFFIHIPKNAGTSVLTKFNVREYAIKDTTSTLNWLCLSYFTYRFQHLESSTFPIWTYENMLGICLILYGSVQQNTKKNNKRIAYICFGLLLLFLSTFIFTASGFMRNQNKVQDTFLGSRMFPCYSLRWLYGSVPGCLLMHATPQELITKGYIHSDTWKKTPSFCIVRNPFSRMVSLYLYNTQPYESFETFVHVWQTNMVKGNVHYCHMYPQHAYTHFNNTSKQAVQYVLRQEHLAQYATPIQNDVFGNRIPQTILDVISNLPQTNIRNKKKNKSWTAWYTPFLENKVLQMYKRDFELFSYPQHILYN